MKSNDNVQMLARGLKAVGYPCRMKIICLLSSPKAVCVSSVADTLGESIAVVSHHLRALAKEGLLEPIRDGKHVCYRLTKNPLSRDIQKLVCKYNRVK